MSGLGMGMRSRLIAGGSVFTSGKKDVHSLTKSLQVLTGNLLASLFLVVRLVYFCLAMFNANSAKSTWSPLTGSTAALVCMALIPEFAGLVLYAWVGFTIDISTTREQGTCGRVQNSTGDKLDEDGRLV